MAESESCEPARKIQRGFVDNWQGGKSLAECNLRMLNAEDLCDVSFRVGGEGQAIKAHRYVLTSRSCVFYSMFTGPLAETSEVTIPDVEVEDFKTFLAYLYTDNTTVNADNVTALLYVAKKYAVTGLENLCRKFFRDNLTVENVYTILEVTHRFDEKELHDKAYSLILEEGNEALMSPDFLELSRDQVDKISQSAELNADEDVLFEAVNKWAESECKRKSLEICPDTKRSVLGDVLKNIKFDLMDLAFISKEVKDSGLVSNNERLDILDNIIRGERSQTPKNSSSSMTVTRNHPRPGYELSYSGAVDAVSFQCNENIKLCGVKLYGVAEGEATYTSRVTLGRNSRLCPLRYFQKQSTLL